VSASDRAPPNRLLHETSPYLLQHAHNPVQWYPWGAEALQRARAEDKPIFLSIGYSACHWCHVMERECFEDAEVAALMNALYVNIKVDREERPDLDEIYMKAVVAMNGSGGWPMSVFLTPELQPFFGATYLPPKPAYGRPSFPELLVKLAELWRHERPRVVEHGRKLTEAMREDAERDLRGVIAADVPERAEARLAERYDPTWGGFGAPPKFPHSVDLRLLLRLGAHDRSGPATRMALHTLERMAAGGIHDQLGGGFHRYSTDARWCIPHFEKMLYDNALLVPAYLEAGLVSGDQAHFEVAAAACDWALREMRTPEGGFASSQDADSEGEEGRYFVWTPAELCELLGAERGAWLARLWDVSEKGNFEHGTSALWLPRPLAEQAAELGLQPGVLQRALAEARPVLLAARGRRVAPATDDKVLSGWNALMISALCQAFQVLAEPRYLEAARAAMRQLLGPLRRSDGRLHATARAGRAQHDAVLDDYAFVVQALLDLYESDFDAGWLREALTLCGLIEREFSDAETGGYFTTGASHEALLLRVRSAHDGALPAGAAVHALSLLRLHELTSQRALGERAERLLAAQGELANTRPWLCAQLLLAHDFARRRPRAVVIGGPDDTRAAALLRTLRRTFLPWRVVARAEAGSDTALLPLLEARGEGDVPRAFVCRGQHCELPVQTPEALAELLGTPD
jgi:uncharacterized protein YyaL (SSP411 family)